MIDIDIASLRRIGLSNFFLAQLGQIPPGQCPARITEVHRDRLTVHDGSGTLSVRAVDGPALAVGDWVLLGADGVKQHLEPYNQIARRASDGQRQVLASNIDTALLVMGLDHDFNPRRIERYVAIVRASEVTPVVVLTKADVASEVDARTDELRQRLPASIDIVRINALSMDARTALSPWLGAGRTLVLLGSSGAGKSTLTNTLAGGMQETGAVRGDDSGGRHTTTARSLHLCADGACIIDTPGLRGMQADADAETVAASFDDIEALARECRFHDCQHGSEPGCAVRDQIDPDRLKNFHKLLREAGRMQQTPLDALRSLRNGSR